MKPYKLHEPQTLLCGVHLVFTLVHSTYVVECRVSIVGITIMVWVSVPHIGT